MGRHADRHAGRIREIIREGGEREPVREGVWGGGGGGGVRSGRN